MKLRKLGHLLKVLGCAALMTTSMTSMAQAVPLVAFVFGPAFAATIGGQILGAVVGAVASFLFSSIASAIFAPKQSADTTQPDPAEVQYGERVSRSAVFGTVLVGGHVVHLNEYDDSEQLQYVGIVGDGWHTSINAVKVAGVLEEVQVVANSGNNETQNLLIEEYEDVIDFRFHDGRPGQLHDVSLVAETDGWTSAKKYSNMAYFVADLESDREKFSGIPDFQCVVEGLRCYDPRKDTTVGGSGSHRFNDPTTWEYTENPAVQAYHYLRGFYFNGVRYLGVGFAASELSLAHFVAAMNVCDETVIDPNASSHPRYACHMMVSDTDEFAGVLAKFCDAMGGYFTELAGQIVIFAGKAQASVLTITDQDLVGEEDLVFNPGRPGETLATGIQGTYTHSEDFQPTPYTALEPAEFENSNWYPHIIAFDIPQVAQPHQAYLLAKQKLFANRVQATAMICLDVKDLLLQVGDWIVWDSAIPHIGERTWKVIQVKYNLPKRRMYLSLQEVTEDIYDDDATPDDVSEPIRTLPEPVYITSVSNLELHPFLLQAPSGATLPAMEFTYTPIIDPGVLAVEIFYRTAADQPDPGDPAGPIFKVTDFTPADGVVSATNGITPGMIHEAYAILHSMPGREVDAVDWDDASTALFPTGELTAITEVGEGVIDAANLTQELQNLLFLISSNDPQSVWARIDEVNAEIERQANAAYTNNANYAKQTTILSRQSSTAAAAVIFEKTVRITADAALAEAILAVEAAIDTAIAEGLAGGYFKLEATVDEMAATAVVALMVKAQLEDAFAAAGIYLKAEADGLGGSEASVLISTNDGEDGSHILVGSDSFRIYGKLTP